MLIVLNVSVTKPPEQVAFFRNLKKKRRALGNSESLFTPSPRFGAEGSRGFANRHTDKFDSVAMRDLQKRNSSKT